MNEKRIGLGVKTVKCTKETLEDFKDFGPITITLNKPEDIMFLHTASLVFTCNNNVKNAEEVLMMMAKHSSLHDPEDAVERVVEEGKKHGFFFPEFYKPLAVALLKHSIEMARKEEDEGK